MKRRDYEDERPTLIDRIIAALLAPLFVNLSAIVTIAVFYRDHPYASWSLRPGSVWFHNALLLSAIAAIVGFVWGTAGLASFLGHCFWTHSEEKRSPFITAAIWTSIACLAYSIAHRA